MKPDIPTEEQIAVAEQIAEKLGRSLPGQVLVSELALRMWTKSMKGRLSESELKGTIPPKRYERLMSAITWYQQETYFERMACPVDGTVLEGIHVLGNVSLRCPCCDFQTTHIPEHIIKLYKEAHYADKSTTEG